MDDLHFFLMLSNAITFCACFAAWTEGRALGQSRAMRYGYQVADRHFIKRLTALLDIEIDNGESPEDFVKWAIEQAQRECGEDGR